MLARVDDRKLAAAFARLGVRRADGWGVQQLRSPGWLLAGAPFVRHLALAEPLWLEACAAGGFRVLAVLDTGEALDLTNPATLANLGTRLHDGLSPAAFGQALSRTSPTAGTVVLAESASNPDSTFGCTPFTNAAAVAGRVALIQRGNCEFATKVLNAQNAGAIAAIARPPSSGTTGARLKRLRKKPVKASARQKSSSVAAAIGSSASVASVPRIGPARPTRASARRRRLWPERIRTVCPVWGRAFAVISDLSWIGGRAGAPPRFRR